MTQGIRHMVIFNLKHPEGSPEAEKFLRDGEEILTSIPVVRNFGVYRQCSVKNDYDYGFSMEFASQEEYDLYNNHPLHTAFVQERWLVEVERFLEIDFERM
ncbi:Dabb family protein [Paenibacillus chartarius]|uniref:Dabb family protein n=1 Tax=Paenibacillus chartarius TaxID=747481 RepID=A0ABV6DV99_9BACL